MLVLLGAGFLFVSGKDAPSQTAVVQSVGSANTATTSNAALLQTATTTNTTQPNKTMTATLHTTMGDITLKFLPEQAPNTVANFLKLAKSGFYDGTRFHRVIKNFMIQGGDPLSKDDTKKAQWGTGGPGYQFNDEVSKTNSNIVGSVAMANSGPNTQGSQFFINAVDNHYLDPNYTVFAQVTSGLDVVEAIDKVATDGSDRPLSPVTITSVVVQ